MSSTDPAGPEEDPAGPEEDLADVNHVIHGSS